MSESSISLRLKINFPVILFAVLFLHVTLMLVNGFNTFTLAEFLPKEKPSVMKIRRVKTQGITHPTIIPTDSIINSGATPSQVSLKDLSVTKSPVISRVQPRPGSRPEVAPRAMNAISLKSKEFKDEVSKSFPSGGLSISDMMSDTQKISDAVVSIEVPDGIEPDELNQYELMFYGFQKRTAMNYINSILKNLDKFQKTHPNYRLPSAGRITMTARVSYDPQGNVLQIKMIRWTHVNELQNLFEEIVKNIDQLHNPPKALWKRDGEFAMFYTLEILNG